MKQLEFFKATKTKLTHGGSIGLKKRKSKRPLNIKKPIHVVLRSDKARGSLSLLNHQTKIHRIIKFTAQKFHISIYETAIVSNHIHLLMRGKRREDIQNFFRTIASLIARKITKAKRGMPFGRFWSYLLFSRQLTSWKKEFEIVRDYILQNTLEALGLIPYKKKIKTTLNLTRDIP